jgi:hypothetical protein
MCFSPSRLGSLTERSAGAGMPGPKILSVQLVANTINAKQALRRFYPVGISAGCA